MSRADVRYRGTLVNGHNPDNLRTTYINTLISGIRVGHHMVMEDAVEYFYQVAVPHGSGLNIELQRQITTPNNNQRFNHHLEVLRLDNNGEQQVREVDGHRIEMRVAEWQNNIEAGGVPGFIITEQAPRAVEVQMVAGRMALLVYTIGDQLSFTEFIISLRRILADHPGRGDVLDAHHDLLNLSSTREHPLLAKPGATGPARWIHVKLQLQAEAVVDEDNNTTTLLMSDHDLYIHGFKNQDGQTYGIRRDQHSAVCLLPEYDDLLDLDVRYRSLLQVPGGYSSELAMEFVVSELSSARNRGRDFMVDAVRVLSSHPNEVLFEWGRMSVGKALAGLILMICESARMDPVHKSFACGWTTPRNPTFSCEQLMHRYVWGEHRWGNCSRDLRDWMHRNYGQPPDDISQLLQDTYLVLDAGRLLRRNRTLNNAPGGGGGRRSGSSSGSGSGFSSGPPGGDDPRSGSGSGSDPHVSSYAPVKETGKRPAPPTGGPSRSPGTRHTSSGDGGDARGQSRRGDDDDSPPEDEDEDEEARDYEGPSHDALQGHGRPRVELLAIKPLSADLGVPGTKIIVFDGKRGQIVYCKEEEEEEAAQQGELQGMDDDGDLVLTGPYTGISAEYGCFAIRITSTDDTPKKTTASSSSITWEWDCDDPECADQVDALEPSRKTIINPHGGRTVAEVTYAVMSNARVANNVQVKLLLPSPAAGVYGEITAYIGDFTKGSKLFSRTHKTKQRIITGSSRVLALDLSRSVVAVPCDWALRIEVDLKIITIQTSDDTTDAAPKELKAQLRFANGAKTAKDGHVQGNVNWYPEMATIFEKIVGQQAEIGRDVPGDLRVAMEKFGQYENPPSLSISEQDQPSTITGSALEPSRSTETGIMSAARQSDRRNQAGKVISDPEETGESSLPAEVKPYSSLPAEVKPYSSLPAEVIPYSSLPAEIRDHSALKDVVLMLDTAVGNRFECDGCKQPGTEGSSRYTYNSAAGTKLLHTQCALAGDPRQHRLGVFEFLEKPPRPTKCAGCGNDAPGFVYYNGSGLSFHPSEI